MKNIIYVNPKEIRKLSPIAGSANTRKGRIKKHNLNKDGLFLDGDWDLTKKTLRDSSTYIDYSRHLKNEKTVYKWQRLIDSIKEKGLKDFMHKPQNWSRDAK